MPGAEDDRTLNGEIEKPPDLDRGRGGRTHGQLARLGLLCLLVGSVGAVVGYAMGRTDDAATSTARLAHAVLDLDSAPNGDDPPDSPGDTSQDEVVAAVMEVMNRVPAVDRPCELAPVPGTDATGVWCTPDQVVEKVLYVGLKSVGSLRREYAAALAESGVTEGQTPGACPMLVPSDSAITSNDLTIGRLHCFEREGRQWLVWTNEPLGIFGLAAGLEGVGAAALFEWWQQTVRPVLTDDELGFYGSVPEAYRAGCLFRFESFSEVQSIPTPEHGSAAACYVQSASQPTSVDDGIVIVHTQHYGAAEMRTEYSDYLSRWGVRAGQGDCPENAPGEQGWEQRGAHGVHGGRIACAVIDDRPTIVWTTDEANILSLALGPPGQGFDVLWDWWRDEAGPLVSD